MLGTIIALCFSFTAYRMARRSGRNVALWIAMVWVLGTVFALLFAFAGSFVDVMAASDEDVDNGNVEPYISFWASAAGTIIGCGVATLLAGRPVRRVKEQQVIDAQVV
jgi:membrane associated rhomboid family serine protease